MSERETANEQSLLLNQSVVGGLALIAFAVFAFWALGDLDSGTLRSMGPGGLPRGVAILIGICGIFIATIGARVDPLRIERVAIRPIIVLMISIIIFAATIRSWSFGSLSMPGLGLMVAGPVTVLASGFAQRERDWLDLAILAMALTAFCMLLFGDMLSLPIPVMPISLLTFFSGWDQRQVLRLIVALYTVIALGLYLIRRQRNTKGAAA